MKKLLLLFLLITSQLVAMDIAERASSSDECSEPTKKASFRDYMLGVYKRIKDDPSDDDIRSVKRFKDETAELLEKEDADK